MFVYFLDICRTPSLNQIPASKRSCLQPNKRGIHFLLQRDLVFLFSFLFFSSFFFFWACHLWIYVLICLMGCNLSVCWIKTSFLFFFFIVQQKPLSVYLYAIESDDIIYSPYILLITHLFFSKTTNILDNWEVEICVRSEQNLELQICQD